MGRGYSELRRIFITSCCMLAVATPASARTDEYALTPLLHVDRSLILDSEFESPVGGYVRFWIERVQPDQRCVSPDAEASTARDYGREARNPILRWLWGRSNSRILQARLTVARSTVVTQSVTLASASHDSSSHSGESWTSEIGERLFLTPYFRVDQGSSAAIEIRLKATREADSAVTQNVLSLIRTGANLVAPVNAPLVTALNGDRLKQTSNYLDSAISSLFQEQLAETSQSDFPAERWTPNASVPAATPTSQQTSPNCNVGRAVAAISARFPMVGHVWRNDGLRDVGEWRIYVTRPTVSIFSTTPLHDSAPARGTAAAACLRAPGKPAEHGHAAAQGEPLSPQDRQACIAFIGLTPSQVLGLQVGENITLGQVLRGDATISAALQRFVNASGPKMTAGDAVAREICIQVAERSQALGLNAYDAAAAIWAFASNGGIAPEISGPIWGDHCTISRLARRLHLDLYTDSAAPVETAAQHGGTEQDPPANPAAGGSH